MAVVTIETMDDEEADIIKDMVENIGLSTTLDVKYDND